MLSSRYLHLHEALGLGPMWLNQSAKLVSADAENERQTDVQTASEVKPEAKSASEAKSK